MSQTRVAIVEDNQEMREALQQLLDVTPGFICTGTYSSCSSIIVNLKQTVPDVVLMDIVLPGISGIEGVRLIKSALPEVDVLMLTVHEDEHRIFESICAGACGYLLKQTPPHLILDAVRDLHRGGAPMSAPVARKLLSIVKNQQGRDTAGFDLSEREQQVLRGLVNGHSYRSIAEQLFISIDTVRSHIKHIYEKLHVHSRSEAVALAVRNRLV